MLQTLLETGARASELVQLRVEDVSLAERVVTIRQGKGGKRREVPIKPWTRVRVASLRRRYRIPTAYPAQTRGVVLYRRAYVQTHGAFKRACASRVSISDAAPSADRSGERLVG